MYVYICTYILHYIHIHAYGKITSIYRHMHTKDHYLQTLSVYKHLSDSRTANVCVLNLLRCNVFTLKLVHFHQSKLNSTEKYSIYS